MAKGRTIKEFYIFIHDSENNYYSVSYSGTGMPTINSSKDPFPILNSPKNLSEFKPAFGTNKTYSSGVRSVTNSFSFVGDGADILRYFDYTKLGYAQELYMRMLRYNREDGILYLYYLGRFDFSTKKDKAINDYTINIVDYGIWGILSQYDTVQYQIDCSSSNPAAIPVLLDGITLKARYTYQPVAFANTMYYEGGGIYNSKYFVVPLAFVNQDGDSSGFISSSQSWQIQDAAPVPDVTLTTLPDFLLRNFASFFIKTVYANQVHITGDYSFYFRVDNSYVFGAIIFHFNLVTNNGAVIGIQSIQLIPSITYIKYTVHIDAIIDLVEGETVTLMCMPYAATLYNWHFLPIVSNILVSITSKATASIAYSLRPLDLIQQIVSRATNNQFTVNSDFFTQNNKVVATCGNAIRNSPNAYITSSFEDWFRSYDKKYWIAFRIINGEMWIELFKTIYDQSTNLFDIGEIKEVIIEQAIDYFFNEIEAGSPKQDYRHSSGRLEFNTTNKFSITQFNIKKLLSLVSMYRTDGYGVEFIRLDYQQESTKDNSGDDSVFMLDITDERSTDGVEVENFVDITVNSAPLAPIITYPFNNDTIRNNLPTIRGLCQPLTTLYIYADGSLDGNTTSDSNGIWQYTLVNPLTYYVFGVTDGVHTIETTFTDLTGTIESRSITLFNEIQSTVFLNIHDLDNLYNNKPLLNGLGVAGATLQVLLDGINIGSAVVDGSCRWFFQMPVMTNLPHIIQVGTALINITVNSFTSVPLITSFSDGFQIVDTSPIVQGVAQAGAKVDLYLDYYPDVSIGTTFADANGNWSIQLIPTYQLDGITVLVPLSEGNHIISTDLTIKSAIVSITGYKLNRPDFTSISGVIDNTVFNTELSPKKFLLTRMSFFKSVFYQQPNTIIKFESGDKNQQFSRTIDGITIKENSDVKISDYNDEALFFPIILKSKVITPYSFVETMDNFSSGGLIKSSYQGFDLYALPIGEMTVDDITQDIQDWNLLLSVKTPLMTLLKLSTPGSTFSIMNNAIYRTDYNMLHMVAYDFSLSPKFNVAELYEDWFENRNSNWRQNPFYIQKIQQSEGIVRDQIITNGISGTVTLNMYRCKDASLYNTFNYSVVAGALPFPDVVQETEIDYSVIPEGDYFLVLYASGNPVCISERIRVAEKHEGTILVDSGNTVNKPGCIFSTGFRSVFRVEGLVKKFQPNIETIINEDEAGDFDIIHSVSSRKRTVLIGDPNGTPDYMYLKIIPALVLDDLNIEQLKYTVDKSANFEPQEQIEGHPMYHYSLDFELKENSQGNVFQGSETNFQSSVVLVADAGAFGLGGGGLINIDLNN